MMHVDPEKLELRQYSALLGEWIDRHSDPGKPKRKRSGASDPADFHRFMAAHTSVQ